jgi:F-type H+-transporting ATPase subunit delta
VAYVKDTGAKGLGSSESDITKKIDSDVFNTNEFLDAAHKEGVEELLNNKELYKFLVSPVIDGDKKKTILKMLAEDAQFSNVTLSFLNLLVDKRRTELINKVVEEFKEIYNEITDTEVANVISAVKIEKPQLALIAKKIQSMSGAKNVRIKNIVDESLIAGFIVQYGKDGSRYIDMSVKGQLDRLASQFAAAEQAAGAF